MRQPVLFLYRIITPNIKCYKSIYADAVKWLTLPPVMLT